MYVWTAVVSFSVAAMAFWPPQVVLAGALVGVVVAAVATMDLMPGVSGPLLGRRNVSGARHARPGLPTTGTHGTRRPAGTAVASGTDTGPSSSDAPGSDAPGSGAGPSAPGGDLGESGAQRP